MSRRPLARRALAELLGTGLLVTVVVGSAIAAQRLSPNDTGLQLLENAAATAAGLCALILMFGPVSGAHFNPVVSLADSWLGRRHSGLGRRELAAYLPAQIAGAVGGAILANLIFGLSAVTWSSKSRSGIKPLSAPAFIAFQFAGLILATVLVAVLYPESSTATAEADVVVPHDSEFAAVTTPGSPS